MNDTGSRALTDTVLISRGPFTVDASAAESALWNVCCVAIIKWVVVAIKMIH